MKRKGEEPATKNDLWAHEAATKKDFSAHQEATKKDFLAHQEATNKDFVLLRKDFATLEASTKEGFKAASARMDGLERVVKNLAVEMTGVKYALVELRQDFSGALTRMESRLVDRMDAFMAKTVKVERDEIWLIHRVDKLEGRVSRIEKRVP